ncbi:AfsR/SARP family transcriptional regulator [Tengunoibacter tsumagoiensis]|uniref:Bacterial transcriptional activator domain-containing protein n=1 Tax=Tengunoibacter tsumagoiensis TaxID=2014871 RepID=A0A401ZUU6_9CHLR|nr:BTAD domain-containing putative transcriptional regulator [Tengunoibacter tsumagoiensis]GCE10653.1 hypothetical protein KTT_05120 [Tengunoibacter tsumagoiensis]
MEGRKSQPLLRLWTLGDFNLARLIATDSHGPARYELVRAEEWRNRGPALTLLKVLLCQEGRQASREELIRLIWHNDGSLNTAHALDSAASVLRKILRTPLHSQSLLQTVRGYGETSLKLSPQSLLWVDADAFLYLASYALKSEVQGQNPLPLLEKAYALIRGPFLRDEFSQPGIQKRRRTIYGAQQRVMFKLVEWYLRAQCPQRAEEVLYHFLEEQPTNEDALGRLMLILGEQERRHEALLMYAYAEDILREEQKEPGQYLQMLARRLRSGGTLYEKQLLYYVGTPRSSLDGIGLMDWMLEGNTMHMDVYTMYDGVYKFTAELDTGSSVGDCQLTLWYAEREREKVFGEGRFLRNFYFEEATERTIKTFCKQFAHDPLFRQEALSEMAPWAQRNALFERNLLSILGEEALLESDGSYQTKAHEFFRWLDQHCAEILALPAYQCLYALDCSPPHQWQQVDAALQDAISLLKLVPGIKPQFSCQGISGKVQYQDYTLLTVSPHEEYAYVSFSALAPAAHDAIINCLPAYPQITTERIPCRFVHRLALRSQGDNLRFREELLELAYQLQKTAEPDWERQLQERPLASWHYYGYPVRIPNIVQGVLPSRLEWLCQSVQIEHTLQLLFHLNAWAKARERLLYADRQGLYEIKSLLLESAYRQEMIQPILYVDGSGAFTKDFQCEIAVELATELFFELISDAIKHDSLANQDREQLAASLFQRITGKQARQQKDIEELDTFVVERYLHACLQELIEEAQISRQPIPPQKLEALLFDPTELLGIEHRRNMPGWDDLDEGELRRLDPEGWSLITFQYSSPDAHYSFHLPLRRAATFLPGDLLERLRSQPGQSREYGSYYGHEITESESQRFPLKQLLYELSIDITHLCPHQLVDKNEYISQRNNWRSYDQSMMDYEDDDEEEDSYEILPLSKQRRQSYPTISCPLCYDAVKEPGRTRLTHWQTQHPNQDLTIGQVAWIFGKNKEQLKQANFALPPDYRLNEKKQSANLGTRYWHIDTLVTAIEQAQEEP